MVLKNIHTNALLSEILRKKRNSEDHGTREVISVKRGKSAFEMVDERIKAKHENLILILDLEPPPQVQKSEPLHRRKKRKGEGYQRWLDEWPWKPDITNSLIERLL